jgi:rubrerythrin
MSSENLPRNTKDRHQTIEVVKRNWQAEMETALTYRDLAERERDEKRKGVLLRMAEAEQRHAQRWEQKLRDLGAEPPVLKGSRAWDQSSCGVIPSRGDGEGRLTGSQITL